MRINLRYFLWAPLSILLLGFPLASKAGTPDGSRVYKAQAGNATASAILVDDHRGGHDRGRWDNGDNHGRRDRDDRWGHERWEHRGHGGDWDDHYYGRGYYYPYYGYNYYGRPYYYSNPYPYGYAYPYSYPYGTTGNGFIGGFLRLW